MFLRLTLVKALLREVGRKGVTTKPSKPPSANQLLQDVELFHVRFFRRGAAEHHGLAEWSVKFCYSG